MSHLLEKDGSWSPQSYGFMFTAFDPSKKITMCCCLNPEKKSHEVPLNPLIWGFKTSFSPSFPHPTCQVLLADPHEAWGGLRQLLRKGALTGARQTWLIRPKARKMAQVIASITTISLTTIIGLTTILSITTISSITILSIWLRVISFTITIISITITLW